MLRQRVSIRATLSILILLFASFAPIVFEDEEMNVLESQDNRYDSSATDRKAWEWLTRDGIQYYRKTDSNDGWKIWEE